MKRSLIVAALLATAALPMGQAGAHDAPHYAAGEPGNPKQKARVVVVAMREGDGKMMYFPSRLEVNKGEQVRFILQNFGELDHEFLIDTTEANLKHYEEMKKNPDMEHDEPNGKRLKPKGKSEILWRFTKIGEFEFACLIPGHREAGMLGKIIVK